LLSGATEPLISRCRQRHPSIAVSRRTSKTPFGMRRTPRTRYDPDNLAA
jgi:hypothetical protein